MMTNEPTRTINAYLKEIGKIPLLTPVEEKDLACRAKRGDKDAKARLVESNLRFVVKIARAYRNQGLPLLDLIQEGNIGLIESIDKFDETLGYRLTTYCGWWIRLAIQRAIEQKARPVKIPVNKFELLRKIRCFTDDYQRSKGKRPTREEVAAGLDLSLRKINEALEAETSFFSLETTTNEDLPPLSAVIADHHIEPPYVQIQRKQAAQRLEEAMQVLSPREKKVLQWRFGLNGKGEEPASLRMIASWVGLSAEGVRRIEEQALSKMRRPVVRRRVEGLI
jgi:RNA polymerase primary sigma factor